jgi:hypothetical protein
MPLPSKKRREQRGAIPTKKNLGRLGERVLIEKDASNHMIYSYGDSKMSQCLLEIWIWHKKECPI